MDGRWPLVGRERVLDQVAEILGRPECSGVVMVGPAGVGKTRLASECREVGERTGFVTGVILASLSASGVPFGALAQLLPPLDEAAAKGMAMLQQAREGLEEMAGDRPLLLVVDDAHLLDSASALLLHQLVQAQAAFVVVTLRAGEAVPDPVVALWKDGLAARIEVGPLPRSAADDLVVAALGGQVEGATLQALWNVSQGNALYLRETVLASLELGALCEVDGLWRFTGAPAPSSRLFDLVERRLAGLAAEEMAAVELLAFGEPLSVEVLDGLVRPAVIDELERKGLVVTERDGLRIQARLAHPMHGEVLRARTPTERAREVQRALADALEATGARRRGDVLRIAVWRLDADDDEKPERFTEAAQQAAFANDFVTARRLAERAFGATADFESALVLADVLYEMGEVERTEEVLGLVDGLAALDRQRGMHAILRASNLYWRLRRSQAAHEVLDDALARIDDPEWRQEVEAIHALLETCAARPLDALRRARPIIERSDGRAFVQAAVAAVLGLPLLGQGREAVSLARAGRDVYVGLGEPQLYERFLMLEIGESLALSQLGELDEAEALARRTYERSLEEAESTGWTFSALALGVALLEQGRPAEAGRWWTEAAGLFRAVQHHGPLRWALAGQLICQGLLGDLDGAEETLGELDAVGPHPAAMHELEVLRGRAWVALARGEHDAARSQLDDAVARAAASGLDWEELVLRHDLVRLGAPPAEHVEAMGGLGGRVQGRLGPLLLEHVRALVAEDAEALGAVSEGLESCGSLLLAAEVATAAADAFERDGAGRAATSWRRAAAQLAARCAGVRTPGTARTEQPAPLSRREREIALLAARGETSREIAERLFLSARTVENHLSRTYDKLGISGREELSEAMR